MIPEELLNSLRVIQSVEDFEVLADDRRTENATLVVLAAGLALRMFWRDPELVASWFAAMEEIDALDRMLEDVAREANE